METANRCISQKRLTPASSIIQSHHLPLVVNHDTVLTIIFFENLLYFLVSGYRGGGLYMISGEKYTSAFTIISKAVVSLEVCDLKYCVCF